MLSKTRYYMKYSALHLVFPIRFHVISRKIDYLWDSALWWRKSTSCGEGLGGIYCTRIHVIIIIIYISVNYVVICSNKLNLLSSCIWWETLFDLVWTWLSSILGELPDLLSPRSLAFYPFVQPFDCTIVHREPCRLPGSLLAILNAAETPQHL